ncbi:MAG: TonB-dependent receptor [Sphingomonadales bacterium]|nr:TonB-dependent receptor [Sphingomonadales bacterium]
MSVTKSLKLGHGRAHASLTVSCAVVALVLPAAAQEAVKLPDMPVTAVDDQQVPAADAQLFNASELDDAALQSLRPATSDTASLLKNMPGVSLYGAGGGSSLPAIHGLADDRLRIKVDGMDLISACGNHMNPPLSYMDPTNVESIKVFAGITPVSLGGDSIGGTILAESSAPEFAATGEGTLLKGETGFYYRSNGNARGANVKATIANETLSMTYSGSTAEADNYKSAKAFKDAGLAAPGRGWLEGDEVGSTAYRSRNHSLSLAMRNENHLTELKLGVQDIPFQNWPNQRMDMTGNDSIQVNLRHTAELDWGSLEGRVYHEKTRHKMQFGDDKLFWYGPSSPNNFSDSGIPCTPKGNPGGCAAGMPMDTEGKNTGVAVKADIKLTARDLLRVGTEAQRYRLDDWWDPAGKGMWPDTFWNINDGKRDRLALFTEWEARWSPQWLTQFGIRAERVEMDAGKVQGYNAGYSADANDFNAADRKRTDNNFDLTALARFTLDATRTIEFGLARKTRSPNLYERYTWSTGGMAMLMVNMAGDGNGYVGNLDLDQEVAHTVSVTFDLHDAAQEKWGLKVSPYYTHVKDYIDAERLAKSVGVTDDFVFLTFVNQSARLYGLDVSGHVLLAKTERYGNFTASGVLNYVRGKNRTTGDNLYNIMPLNVKLAVSHRLNSWTNTIELEWVDDKDRVSQVRNEIPTDSYSLVHLRSSYEWKRVRFDIGVENVFDEFYSHPLSGAYTGQGATMPPKPGLVPWGVTVPGMGRSIYAGVNIKF